MFDVQYQPSGLAPLRVVREVKRLIPAAIEAVEAHMGETVPPLTIVIANPVGMAIARVLAAKDERSTWRQAFALWRDTVQDCRSEIGVTTSTRTDRVLIGLYGAKLRWAPKEIWSTLVHELVHAVQNARPGRHAEMQANLDHNWGLVTLSASHCHVLDAVTAIEEAEAYAIERALNPHAEAEPAFDRAAVFTRLVSAVSHWEAAVKPAPEPAWGEAA